MPVNAVPRIALLVLILCVTAGLASCGSQREQLVGTYTAAGGQAPGAAEATLELQADGKGFWSSESDNAPFRWDFYQGRVRLHTPSGGVLEGTLVNGAIEITLPGLGLFRFQRNG
ncbi:MAG: hypothetical protein V1793_24290 [Pseudomonadota bacterium]